LIVGADKNLVRLLQSVSRFEYRDETAHKVVSMDCIDCQCSRENALSI